MRVCAPDNVVSEHKPLSSGIHEVLQNCNVYELLASRDLTEKTTLRF